MRNRLSIEVCKTTRYGVTYDYVQLHKAWRYFNIWMRSKLMMMTKHQQNVIRGMDDWNDRIEYMNQEVRRLPSVEK